MKRWIVALVVALGLGSAVAAPAGAAGEPMRRVTVIDSTHGAWDGVKAVVDAWRRSPYLDAKIARACRPRTYCVYVEANDYGLTDWQGETYPLGEHVAVMHLNLGVTSETLESAVFCHEFGHVLGIPHPAEQPTGWGCIAGADPTPTPSVQDMAQLVDLATGAALQGPPQEWGAFVQ